MLLLFLCFGPMGMALVSWLAGRKSPVARTVLVLGTCTATLAGCLSLWPAETACLLPGFCGLGLSLRADGFRSLYAAVAAFMWLVTSVFSQEYLRHDPQKNRYWFFNLMTLGATLGVLLSDDLYTTLIFFEIMSLTSYTWVAQEENPEAMRAAGTYLAVAVIGGLTTLMGLFLLWHELGTLTFDGLEAALGGQAPNATITTAAWLTLFGFAAKAGLFPLHIWLPKAHPVAPAPASALLSGMLTKSGVFGMLVICTRMMRGVAAFGIPLLLLGAATMLLGAVLALFSVNLKRTLACSSVSQIGFITVGTACMTLLGEEGSLAAYGVIEHMLNHSLIKLCLFMCAGVVFMNLEELELNRIRGFGQRKPVLAIAFGLGAIAIGCIPPLGSGFNSKSLLHEGILELLMATGTQGEPVWPLRLLEYAFIFSGGLTIAYMVKLFVCLFVEKNEDEELQEAYDSMSGHYISRPSAAALLLSALPLPLMGLLGERLLSPCAARSMPFLGLGTLPSVHYFSAENLIGAAESLGVGILVYALFVRRVLMRDGRYINRWPAWLDMEDRFWRPILRSLTEVSYAVVRFVEHIPDSRLVREWIPTAVTAAVRFVEHIPDSRPVREWIPAAITTAVRFVEHIPDSYPVRTMVPSAVTAVFRFVGEIPERLVLLLRRTVFRPVREHRQVPVGNAATWYGGRLLDRLAAALNATILRRAPLRTDYEYLLDAQQREFRMEGHQVGRSMSFNLLLLAAGLLGVCVYLLLR